jgi:hypothetical protein
MGLVGRLSVEVPNKGIDLSGFLCQEEEHCCTTVSKDVVSVWGATFL